MPIGHMGSHNGNEVLSHPKYTCHICPTSFISKKGRRSHIYWRHELVNDQGRSHIINNRNQQNCDCITCGKQFQSNVQLDQHINTEHVNDVRKECKLCRLRFNTSRDLNTHTFHYHPNEQSIDDVYAGRQFRGRNHKSSDFVYDSRTRHHTSRYISNEWHMPLNNRFSLFQDQGNELRGL